MPNDDTHKPPQADDIAPKSAPLRWLWTTVKGLSLFTVLSGLFTVLSSLAVGYFQYLNAYQEKVSSLAKEDMTLAAATFTDISHAFSEMQALQQTLYTDFANAVGGKSDAGGKALATNNARAISERYEKARIALRENIDLLTRKAEIYIDRASDSRDPAEKHNVDEDPLSRRVLRDYAFDCSDTFNFPAFGNVRAPDNGTPPKEVADDRKTIAVDKNKVAADQKILKADEQKLTNDINKGDFKNASADLKAAEKAETTLRTEQSNLAKAQTELRADQADLNLINPPVVFKPVPGLTAAYMRKAIACQQARFAFAGMPASFMPEDPTLLDNTKATVFERGGHLEVLITTESDVEGAVSFARAQDLLHPQTAAR